MSNRVRVVLATAALLLWPVFTGTAQEHPPAYSGVDILFLVDQSGSMSGEAFGEPEREATDPLNLRFDAAQYALDIQRLDKHGRFGGLVEFDLNA